MERVDGAVLLPMQSGTLGAMTGALPFAWRWKLRYQQRVRPR